MCAGTETEGIGNILYQLPAIYILVLVADSHTDNNTSSKEHFWAFWGFQSCKKKKKKNLYPTHPCPWLPCVDVSLQHWGLYRSTENGMQHMKMGIRT